MPNIKTLRSSRSSQTPSRSVKMNGGPNGSVVKMKDDIKEFERSGTGRPVQNSNQSLPKG